MTERTLARRYELLELIGGGGMADVYKAHDKLLDRPVAVKILHAQFSNDADFIDKFHREAQGAARLAHPNIVNIYDVGEEAGSHYIVMEYVPGDTLKTRIQQEGHLSVEESLQIAKDIASALEQAHRNNLVHCDIKPHNILMMPDGHIKVADFGIARAVTASTMTYSGSVIGTGERDAALAFFRALPLARYTALVCDFANWADTAPLPCLILKKPLPPP